MGRITRALALVHSNERMGVERRRAGAGPVIASPYQTESDVLSKIVWPDITGADADYIVTRAVAMRVPAMARARHSICGFGARAPLRCYEGDALAADQPAWLSRTDNPTQLPPFHRMLWTLDDIMFTGWSLWGSALDTENKVADAARIPRHWWKFNEHDQVEILAEAVPWEGLILIPGPHEGLLHFADDTIRRAYDTLQSASKAARNPVPSIDLHDEGDEQLTDPEIDALIQRWIDARQNHGVGYTSKGVKANPLGQHPEQLMIDGRNADAVDIARDASMPAALVDASQPKSTLTYETTEGRNGILIDYGLQLYWDSIAARLSMDDVVPRGKRVAFDATAISSTPTPPPTGPSLED